MSADEYETVVCDLLSVAFENAYVSFHVPEPRRITYFTNPADTTLICLPDASVTVSIFDGTPE